ncbi:hypothetical protein EI555_006411 [Monodon monoceros]|uniref:Translationally-controlled tumor protein n=1 Tax=Monodon monoceros TaxID=40151 RepID=A0A4U1F3X6_MONMO|nr:hypothetical protein EI555_006411 [Monodon monoceros]
MDKLGNLLYKIQPSKQKLEVRSQTEFQETSFTKEANKKYIKDYMKSIKGKLEEQRPERGKPFMTGAAEQIKHILDNFRNYQFFIGENMNPDGMAALLDYHMFPKCSETVGSTIHQEGIEIRSLKRTTSFSPLIKSIIPTEADNSACRKPGGLVADVSRILTDSGAPSNPFILLSVFFSSSKMWRSDRFQIPFQNRSSVNTISSSLPVVSKPLEAMVFLAKTSHSR